MLIIKKVEAGGIGAELGLVAGDRILALNGHEARDILDYYFHVTGEEVSVRVETGSGQLLEYEIEKDYQEDLGLEFELRPRQCRNQCIFCFIDQQPPNLRQTLYVKDDDYRLSFLHGNYITLTNLSRRDVQRIVGERISPLYISIHASDPAVRSKLLGRDQGRDVMELLRLFAGAGITFHGQIVLCPGYNDGAVLEQTLADLAGLGEALLSLAVVPVGLTKHREYLPPLRPVTAGIARKTIELIDAYQEKFLRDLGRRAVYAADEFYVRAGLPVPDADYYEDFAQLENGIGLVRRTLTQAEKLREMDAQMTRPGRVLILTGVAAAPTMEIVAAELMRVFPKLKIRVQAVENQFLGPQITVAGLLTGADILEAAEAAGEFDLFLVPEAAVRAGCFLDDCTVADLARALDKPVQATADVQDIVEILESEV
ncbi:MAG: DUF512 domain-containing protein [Bacillota bacterium]|jgi:putative radical SAM enzyme (TIGR03279 family)